MNVSIKSRQETSKRKSKIVKIREKILAITEESKKLNQLAVDERASAIEKMDSEMTPENIEHLNNWKSILGEIDRDTLKAGILISKPTFSSDGSRNIGEKILTPETCKRIESGMGQRNRNLKDGTVKDYARSIRKGEFKLISSPIMIDSRGNVNDGHHRINACILADKPLHVKISDNEVPSTQANLDKNETRSSSDTLAVLGFVWSKKKNRNYRKNYDRSLSSY